MKAVVNKKEVHLKPQFPKLMTNKLGDVILIINRNSYNTARAEGFVVASNHLKIGEFSALWIYDALEDFHGEVVLSSE